MPRVSITVSGKNPQPYRFKLDRDAVKIGRASDNDIVIDCPSVSSHHATMNRVEGGYVLKDKNSTNGVKLDDTLMEVIDLKEGLDIQIGDVEFGYSLTDDESKELDKEDFVSQEKKKLPRARRKSKKAAPSKAPARQPQALPVASATESPNFLMTLAALILAALAFIVGMSLSYSNQEKRKGREDVSLFKDMKDGRPLISQEKEGDSESSGD